MLLQNHRLIDLTHTLNESVPTWEGICGFRMNVIVDYPRGLRVHHYDLRAGIGTHMDAPVHLIPGGRDIASIEIANLMVPAHVIDLTAKCSSDLIVVPDDIVQYEKNWGEISENSLVIFNTGWSRYWRDPIQYRNPDVHGKMHFPQIAVDTAKLLLNRKIAGIAIDTLSPETDSALPVHRLVLGADKYIIENIANADLLPPRGAQIIALPPKIQNGSESTLRVIGLLPLS